MLVTARPVTAAPCRAVSYVPRQRTADGAASAGPEVRRPAALVS